MRHKPWCQPHVQGARPSFYQSLGWRLYLQNPSQHQEYRHPEFLELNPQLRQRWCLAVLIITILEWLDNWSNKILTCWKRHELVAQKTVLLNRILTLSTKISNQRKDSISSFSDNKCFHTGFTSKLYTIHVDPSTVSTLSWFCEVNVDKVLD